MEKPFVKCKMEVSYGDIYQNVVWHVMTWPNTELPNGRLFPRSTALLGITRHEPTTAERIPVDVVKL
jgi:hypothetical protein